MNHRANGDSINIPKNSVLKLSEFILEMDH